jgi:two-component system chemotaxis response regulator CheY
MTIKILAVDDSRTMRDMVEYTLTGAGYDVTLANDGAIAVDILKDGQFDLIITDINMPNMNGIELVKIIRESGANQSVPILILTTEASDSQKQAGKSAGATGWLVKPFVPEKLLQVVKKVCY